MIFFIAFCIAMASLLAIVVGDLGNDEQVVYAGFGFAFLSLLVMFVHS